MGFMCTPGDDAKNPTQPWFSAEKHRKQHKNSTRMALHMDMPRRPDLMNQDLGGFFVECPKSVKRHLSTCQGDILSCKREEFRVFLGHKVATVPEFRKEPFYFAKFVLKTPAQARSSPKSIVKPGLKSRSCGLTMGKVGMLGCCVGLLDALDPLICRWGCQEKRAKRPDHLPRSKTSGPVVIALEARANGAENGRCWEGRYLEKIMG